MYISTLVCKFRCYSLLTLSFLILGVSSTQAAESSGGIEEVVVTAQRTEESLQDVPVAITAFTGDMMEDKQIITPSDLQMNAPNVSFTPTNFGGSSFSIRGIGRLVIAGSGEDGVSIHENAIPIVTNLNAVEYYDMERVEMLRGPQGTLFGRNATGGVVNMITVKPHMEGIDGFFDMELGDFNHTRVKAALNIPIADTFAIRLAGMQLKRDGYTDNLAAGRVSDTCLTVNGAGALSTCGLAGIDDDIDGRELYSIRLTALWNISDNSSLWVSFTKSDEDDDKARFTNQVCKRSLIPVQGCEPDGFGFDAPHAGATTGGIFAGLNGAVELGTAEPTTAFPRPQNMGFRDVFTDFEPVFDNQEETWSFGFNYDFEQFTLTLQGAVQETKFLARQDYNLDVGWNLKPTDANPSGYWPTSEPAGGAGGDWTNPECNFNDGTSGIYGGCILTSADPTRLFAYDQADNETDYWTIEAKIQSNLDGQFNFLMGMNVSQNEYFGDYYVVSNSLDLVGVYGVPLLGFPPLYPTMFNNTGNPAGEVKSDSTSFFGEVYFQASDDIKITAGLRYNDDEKVVSDSAVLYNSLDANAALSVAFNVPNLLGPDPVWVRTSLGVLLENPLAAFDPNNAEGVAAAQLLNYYGGFDTWLTAFGGGTIPEYLASVVALSQVVPYAPGFGEARDLTGSPKKADWQETTGRIGIDWQINDNSMAYAFYTLGYKPGGFNPPLNASFVSSGTAAYTFDSEEIGSLEFGSKNILLDGTLQLNGSFFIYDYKGLQVTRIANNTSINDNIDSDIIGLEAELVWQPASMPELTVDAGYSWLNAEVNGSESVDPVNRTGGQADWITLNNIDPGSLTGVNYIARESQIDSALITEAYGAFGAPSSGVGSTPCGALSIDSPRNGIECPGVVDGTNYGGVGGIPAYFSRSFLEANFVETSDGNPVSLDGNKLPNSPEHTIKVGAAYTFSTSYGTFTPRWDYYWQAESYAREFNSIGDQIEAWDQHNLSLIYQSNGGEWTARLWVRNVQDEENVTGKYLTSDTSGFYRNYFLTEPRIFGVSVRWQPVN